MPDALNPLGWRARVSTSDSDGTAGLFRGKVHDQLGCFRERRLPMGVFCTDPPSAKTTTILNEDKIELTSKANDITIQRLNRSVSGIQEANS